MAAAKPSSLVDTQVVYCGDNAPPSPAAVSLRSALDQLKNLPDRCVDLISIDPPRENCRATAPVAAAGGAPALQMRAFEDRHESTRAYIDYMRPRCVELERVLKKTGSFYYHCDWHASHYMKVMLGHQCYG
jgi:DNA modification methylase